MHKPHSKLHTQQQNDWPDLMRMQPGALSCVGYAACQSHIAFVTTQCVPELQSKAANHVCAGGAAGEGWLATDLTDCKPPKLQ